MNEEDINEMVHVESFGIPNVLISDFPQWVECGQMG